MPTVPTFAVREPASLGIMGVPRVPPLNPSESILLSEHYRLVINAHTSEYFKSMKLLKIEDIFKLKLLIPMFTDRNFETNQEIHFHNTRNRMAAAVPYFNRAKSQSTWLYQKIQLWNSLPSEITSANSVTIFKSRLKNHFISLY